MLTKMSRGSNDVIKSLLSPDGTLTLDLSHRTLHLHDGATVGGAVVSMPVRLKGPYQVTDGSGAQFVILGFDAFSTYGVTAELGDAVLDGDTITYTAPTSQASDFLTVSCNGLSRTVELTITPLGIEGNVSDVDKGVLRIRQPSVTTYNGDVFVFGEDKSGLGNSNAWRYNPQSTTWTELTPCPNALSTLHIAHPYNGEIWLMKGGSGRIDVYDPGADSWSTIASGPTGELMTVMNDIVYSTPEDYGNPFYAFDLDTLVETSLASTPDKADFYLYNKLAAVNGYIALFGGGFVSGNDQYMNPNLYWYNPQTDTWRQNTENLTGRINPGAIEIDGLLYIFGGDELVGESVVFCPDVTVVDPRDDSVSTLTQYSPSGSAQPFANITTVGAAVYVFYTGLSGAMNIRKFT